MLVNHPSAWLIRQVSAVLVASTLSLVLSLSAPAHAQPDAASLQALLDSEVRRQHLPGAVLSVRGPEIDLTLVSGVLNRRTGALVTPNSRFYIASTGKMMTAVAVLQLVDEGRIALDQTVASVLVSAGALTRLPNWRSVRVEQLLNHTSGMPDYFDDNYQEAAVKDRRLLADVEHALSDLMGEQPNAKPGAVYEYSNTNYALLGLILERVDNADLATVLERRIFAPADMTGTSVGADPGESTVASAHGTRGRPSANDNLIAYESRLGDGPVTTTGPDLGRFFAALLREEKLLKPATLQRMLRSSPREPKYGLGIEIDSTDWGPCYGHSGSVTGFNAEAWFYSARQTSIIFLTNGEYRTDDFEIVSKVADVLFKVTR